MSNQVSLAHFSESAQPSLPSEANRPSKSTRLRWYAARLALILSLLAAPLLHTPAVLAEESGVHVVQRGDSLAAIAQRYDVSLNALAQNNGIANPNIIYVGQRLVIPGSAAEAVRSAASATLPGNDGYHTVRRGDTLAQIARNHGMTINDLLRLNGLTNPNFIWTGQQLRVSARVDALAPDEKIAKPVLADQIYVVKAGDSLATIAEDHNTSAQALMVANGLPNPNFVWTGQRLRVNKPLQTGGLLATDAPADGVRWIEVNLSTQTLTAWQGNVPVLHTSVSTGTSATPTVTGRFPIYMKLSSQHMSGPGYSLPGVPWVMYFYSGYAIHGTYWHNNFGTPMSHGCVNMRIGEAEFLYSWASEGTEVYVHY